MNPSTDVPMVSVVIPTLNAERVLEECLGSIFAQDWPRDRMELIVADGGSTDRTLEIVARFARRGSFCVTVKDNPLKTGEAGKAVGVRHAAGDIVSLIDSDNILPDPGWLRRMIAPLLEDDGIVAAEPVRYTYRPADGLITRYCALLGMNDPLCLFTGNYDRFCHLTGLWTGMPVAQEKRRGYVKVTVDPERMPTFGANGFFMRKKPLCEHLEGDYLFDIDLLVVMARKHPVWLAKVDTGIIHVFSGDCATFVKKQRRRIVDFLHYTRAGMRAYPWGRTRRGAVKFVLYTALVFPLVLQAAMGYRRTRDTAWCFHPVACMVTAAVYSYHVLWAGRSAAGLSRSNW